MRIIFMGSQEFSVEFLKALIKDEHEIVAVFTRKSKPAGRNQKLSETPVHIFSEENNLSIRTPKSLKNVTLNEFEPIDFIIVVSYGLILPSHFINHPSAKCINVHPSLLPRWRGAAPIERTLWHGDKITAATIMRMDEGLDTGDILSMEKIDVENNDNFQSLTAKLLHSAKLQLMDVINNYNSYKPQVQSTEGVTYADKITNDDKRFNFRNQENFSAFEIHNKIRALSGKSGLLTKIINLDEEFKILKAEHTTINNNYEYGVGVIIEKKFCIACMDGLLIPTLLQKTTGKGAILTNQEFINGVKNKLTIR